MSSPPPKQRNKESEDMLDQDGERKVTAAPIKRENAAVIKTSTFGAVTRCLFL
jgi:hypothetical protein